MTDRGTYRSISTVLARGKDFRRLSPAAKLVFYTVKLELGPSGIDVYDVELLPKYTGLPDQDVTAALAELYDGGWVVWEDNVVWIVRGLEFEPSLNRRNEKHRKSLASHLNGLPRLAIVQRFRDHYAWWFAGHSSPPDDPSGYQADTNAMVSDYQADQGKGRGKGKREREKATTSAPVADAPALAVVPMAISPTPPRPTPRPAAPSAENGAARAAKREAKYPHYPPEVCDALHLAWVEGRGACEYGRFRKATALLFDRPTPRYEPAELVAALNLCLTVLSHRAKVGGRSAEWEFLTPERWVGRVVEWVENHRRVQRDPMYLDTLLDGAGAQRKVSA